MATNPEKPDVEYEYAPRNVKLKLDEMVCPVCHGHGLTYSLELRESMGVVMVWKDVATKCRRCGGRGKVGI